MSTTSQSRPADGGTASDPASVRHDDAGIDEWSTYIPHDCVTDSAAELDEHKRSLGTRLVGLDAARGIALIGMVAVHTISAANVDGEMTLAWSLASGKSSALFAVLGGVGLAFMSGRRRPPTGADWGRAILRQIVRAVAILTVGLLLGAIVPVEDIAVILPYLALMFAVGSLLLPLTSRTLIALGLIWAVVSPFISHWLRVDMTAPTNHNITLGTLIAAPGDDMVRLLLTGAFPVITWMAYIAIGIGLGRANLGGRRTVAALVAGGVGLTLMAAIATWVMVNQVGVYSRIAAEVMGHTTLETFSDYLVFGGSGALPTDSGWWLGVNAPHTGTPLDLLYTAGIAMAIIGLCLGVSHVSGSRMTLLAVPGSMTLTLYSMHVVLVLILGGLPEPVHFAAQLVILAGFAFAWRRWVSNRGPLEGSLAWLTRTLVPNPELSKVGPAKPISAVEARWRD